MLMNANIYETPICNCINNTLYYVIYSSVRYVKILHCCITQCLIRLQRCNDALEFWDTVWKFTDFSAI